MTPRPATDCRVTRTAPRWPVIVPVPVPVLLVLLVTLLLVAHPALVTAQVTPEILIKPWQEGAHWSETVDDLKFFAHGHTQRTDLDTAIWDWDSSGRIRVDREATAPRFVIGYRVLALEIESDLPAINGSPWDIALVGAGPLGTVGDDWELGAGAGLGTATDGHFSNVHALYGVGFFNASRALADTAALHLGLEYNGNRVFQPQLPLPYVAWEKRWNDQLVTVLGLPVSRLVYRPCAAVVLRAGFFLPSSVAASLDVRVRRGIHLFAEFGGATDAFVIDDTVDDRLFYRRRWVAGGLRAVTPWIDASLGIGYALEHEFETGESIDAVDTVADLSEKPFLLVRLRGTF